MRKSYNSPNYFTLNICQTVTPNKIINDDQPNSLKKLKLSQNINSKQSFNTSFRTPSPAPYYLRRKKSIHNLYTMSDSKLEQKRKVKEEEKNDFVRNENNVCVAIRVRPLSSKELNPENSNLPVTVDSEEKLIRLRDKTGTGYLEFTFDHCFNSTKPSAPDYMSQEKVYNAVCDPLFDKIFNGNNVCVFAYGQTGSGKSHTMMGTSENNGIIPRFAKELISKAKNHDKKIFFESSYFEIYNEKIHDLLVEGKVTDEKTVLKIREKPGTGPYVENLSTHQINTIEDLLSILTKGNKHKATASTLMNDRSNRSHVIFTLNVYEQKSIKLDENSAKKKPSMELLSKINFIDLAGSERASALGLTGDRLKEGNSINKSLLTLGKVITQLSENDSNHHISYRESSLTYLLKECLGGNSYTCMIATVSPSYENLEETLSTLRYASKARRIVNKIKQNKIDNSLSDNELENKLSKINEMIEADLKCFKEMVSTIKYKKTNLASQVNELFSSYLQT